MSEEVLSVQRPLMVERSPSQELKSTEIIDSSMPENEIHQTTAGVADVVQTSGKQEFFSEEITQHAHVTMGTPRTLYDVISQDLNTPAFFTFAFLATASMFVSLGAEVPTLWLLSGVASISMGLFWHFKL